MSVAVRVLFIFILIYLIDSTTFIKVLAQENMNSDKQSYEVIKEKMFPSLLEISKREESLELLGKIRIFYSLPNSINMRIYGHQSLESDGLITDNQQRINKIDAKTFSLFKYWSISRTHFPESWWSWGIRFSPSLSFFSWSDPGEVLLGHLLYNAKGLLNLPNSLGTIFAAAGIGPMFTDGNIYSANESNNITFAPRFQLGYYRFIDDKFYLQLKYNKYYLKDNIFNGNGFSINNFDIMGIYIGYYFPNI